MDYWCCLCLHCFKHIFIPIFLIHFVCLKNFLTQIYVISASLLVERKKKKRSFLIFKLKKFEQWFWAASNIWLIQNGRRDWSTLECLEMNWRGLCKRWAYSQFLEDRRRSQRSYVEKICWIIERFEDLKQKLRPNFILIPLKLTYAYFLWNFFSLNKIPI